MKTINKLLLGAFLGTIGLGTGLSIGKNYVIDRVKKQKMEDAAYLSYSTAGLIAFGTLLNEARKNYFPKDKEPADEL